MITNLKQIKGDPILVSCGIECDTYRLPYDAILKDLSLMRVNNEDAWLEALNTLCSEDFFMFCLLILELPVNNPYLLARCYEIQDNETTSSLWLWFRDGFKSTLVTYARTLWRYTRVPSNRVALFSNSRLLIKPRFKQLKNTMEKNMLLKRVWPDVFYMNPDKDAPTWTIDDGLFLKQNSMPWPSLSAFGLIDAMPTGGHYNEKVIDDLVDLKNIGTKFMMMKVLEAYRMADNLGSGENTIENIIGTRYKFKDLYEHIMNTGLHRTSIIAGEVDDDGKPKYGGTPIYYSKEYYDKKKIKQAGTYWPQILMSPQERGDAIFKKDHLKFYNELPDKLFYYIIGEPASDPALALHPEDIDYTALMLIATAPGERIYIVDMVRDKIGVKDKWDIIKDWHTRYEITGFAYEEYANQKDREFFNIKMQEERFYIDITPLRKDKSSKESRIMNLCETFASGKIFLPRNLYRMTRFSGMIDVVDVFIKDEYEVYPNGNHDDALDCLAKIHDEDLKLIYPEGEIKADEEQITQKKVSAIDIDDDYSTLECTWGDL